MMFSAGVARDEPEPPVPPISSTMIDASTPRPSPSAIAAGALQRRQVGWSGGSGAGPGSNCGVGGGTLAVIQEQG